MLVSEKDSHLTSSSFLKTRSAVFLHELLNAPLSSLCLSAGFILYKSLGGSAFQVALLTMLKPSVSLLILYWSASIHSSKHNLMQNLVWSGIFARLPFLIFPWVNSPWIFIACVGIYLFFHRAGTPAWIEIMKMNLPSSHRGKIYSFASALSHAECFLLSFWIGPWLDLNEFAWRWLFPIAAIFGSILIFVQKGLPICCSASELVPQKAKSFKEKIVGPWKEAWFLMKKRPDFRRFQVGFFLCGFGLMMAMAVIPIYAVDVLDISYKELITALLVCQGFGYVLTSRVWGHQLDLIPIFKLMAYVIFCFVLFGCFILLTSFYTNCLYIAYFIYGVAQAGSRLCWNLSAPIFSKEKNSTVYSSVNILMVGVRGLVAPLLGSFLCATLSPQAVLVVFITLSFFAMFLMNEKKSSLEQVGSA